MVVVVVVEVLVVEVVVVVVVAVVVENYWRWWCMVAVETVVVKEVDKVRAIPPPAVCVMRRLKRVLEQSASSAVANQPTRPRKSSNSRRVSHTQGHERVPVPRI